MGHGSPLLGDFAKWVVNSNKTDSFPSGNGCRVNDSEKVLVFAKTLLTRVNMVIKPETPSIAFMMSMRGCSPLPASKVYNLHRVAGRIKYNCNSFNFLPTTRWPPQRARL